MAEKKNVSVKVVNMAGEEVGKLNLKASVYGIEPNEAVMYDAILVEQANQRQATAKTKKRSEVSGGGKKPFRQKGTGRARAGSSRSPIWVGGGTVWGPDGTQNYKLKQNKKAHQLAVKSALSSKLRDKELTVVDKIAFSEPKTKAFVNFLLAINASGKILVVADEIDYNLALSSLNLGNVKVTPTDNVSVYDLVHCDVVVMTQGAAKEVEEALN